MLKIISGRLKGRNIETLPNAKYRPSTTKFREGVFSILSSGRFADNDILQDANILDLFAGTGGLSFEGLSRGAKHVYLVEIDRAHIKCIKENAEYIGEENNMTILRLDATNMPEATMQFDIVFMDPPYSKGLVDKSLKSIAKQNWLQDQALVLVETSRRDDIIIPSDYELLDSRIYGNNKMYILRYIRD